MGSMWPPTERAHFSKLTRVWPRHCWRMGIVLVIFCPSVQTPPQQYGRRTYSRVSMGDYFPTKLTHFVPKLRRDVAMAGLELAVGFPHLVELPFQTALGRPGFAEIPLAFFPLGAELLSLLLKLLHCVGHVDLDGEHIRFGHCADILHRSPLFLAGRLGGSAREQRSPGDRSREGFPRGSDGREMGRTRVKLLLAPEAPRHEARHQRGGPLMAWSTPSAHDSSSRSSKGGCWNTIVEPETHPGITIAPSPSRSCRIIASPIADREVYCGSPGEARREKDLPGARRAASVTAGRQGDTRMTSSKGDPRYRRGQAVARPEPRMTETSRRCVLHIISRLRGPSQLSPTPRDVRASRSERP